MWLTFLIRALIAFVLAPAVAYLGVQNLIKHSAGRSGKIWLAVASSTYAVFAVVLGMAMGGAAGQSLSSALSLTNIAAWLSFVAGAAMSLVLSISMILKVYSKMHVRQE